MAEHVNDTARVIAPPPLLLLIALLAGAALDLWAPVRALAFDLPPAVRWIGGAVLIAFALWVSFAGSNRFGRAGTPVEPWKASTALVTDGIFAHVRNPMYLGFVTLMLGIGVALGGGWTILAAIALLLTIHFGVVLREERYLERRFGADYTAYKASVPRYGWRF